MITHQPITHPITHRPAPPVKIAFPDGAAPAQILAAQARLTEFVVADACGTIVSIIESEMVGVLCCAVDVGDHCAWMMGELCWRIRAERSSALSK